ncbi:MAG TPA: RagB/SusD family nutrient uptake outer membrane protein [Bacteroidales bacterium]|nr:RagB/SusD family nutrient uptake outer membrane protein [Bacteroidales bacterium]
MKKITIIILTVLFFSACTEQLDITPKGNLELGNFFATPEDFDLALTGAYDPIGVHQMDRGYGSYFKGLLMMGRAGTDEMYVNQGFWDATGKEIGNYTYTAFSRIPGTTWEMQYIGISRCNVVIGKIKENKVVMPEATKARILGEASFLRGFYYFQLVRFYGGVPIITDETNLNKFKNIRGSVAETYSRIIADFKVAEENLPTLNESGRATKFAAKSFLAKAYLQMSGEPLKDPSAAANAAKYAKDVIDNGGYDLEANYTDVFSLEKEHGKEYIFSVEYIATDNEGGQLATWDGPPGNWTFTLSYSICNAMPELYNSYSATDKRRDYNVVNYMVTDATGKTEPTNDGRYYAFKWRHNPDPAKRGYSTEWQSPYNFPLTRFADILLVYAEAQCRADKSPNADAYAAINRIRTRAGLPNLSGLSESAFLSAVLDERKWELCYEGHRWFDLVRYGKLIEVVRACNVGNPFAATNIQNHHVLFPIPDKEILISNGDLVQNPNY